MNFRNLTELSLEFADGLNVVVGPNGIGKTNLLEAIAYLSIPRSFRGVQDRGLVRWGTDFMVVEGTVADEITRHVIKIALASNRKRIEIDSHPIKSYSELFATFVSFVVSHHDHELIDGAPSFRRKRFDRFISTFSPDYFRTLLDYRNIVEQKNFVLKNEPDERILRAINARMMHYGNRLIEERRKFVESLSERFSGMVLRLVGKEGDLRYVPSVEKLTNEELDSVLPEEIRRGFSLVGPHRDDYVFELESHRAAETASEGEKRLMVLALVMSVRQLWEEVKGEAPVLLLDEPLSLLGDDKILQLKELLTGQTILTAIRHPFSGANVINLGKL